MDNYELLMPFVVCQSKGGPYDDESFVAGYQVAHIDAKLESCPDSLWWTGYTALLPQFDLIAMRHGYRMEHKSTEYDEWTHFTLYKVPPLLAP